MHIQLLSLNFPRLAISIQNKARHEQTTHQGREWECGPECCDCLEGGWAPRHTEAVWGSRCLQCWRDSPFLEVSARQDTVFQGGPNWGEEGTQGQDYNNDRSKHGWVPQTAFTGVRYTFMNYKNKVVDKLFLYFLVKRLNRKRLQTLL